MQLSKAHRHTAPKPEQAGTEAAEEFPAKQAQFEKQQATYMAQLVEEPAAAEQRAA
jgi:hypothetical protein